MTREELKIKINGIIDGIVSSDKELDDDEVADVLAAIGEADIEDEPAEDA